MAIRTAISIDFSESPKNQSYIHNRWHPEVPVAAKVSQGETFKVECFDWTGGQIGNNDSADDIRNVDLTCIHYISGPIHVQGAKVGDVLEVEIHDVQPFQDQPWGYCGIFPKENGGGFLDNHYPEAAKAIFDFEGINCSSRHIPGVKFPGLIHPGILGTAPSQEILDQWNYREAPDRIAKMEGVSEGKVLSHLPLETMAHGGSAEGEVLGRIAKYGARTIPGRPENGGNCDIKNLSRGSKVYFPVYVDGANLSVGDLHFSMGDGEISFCGAIEMAGIITLQCRVITNGVKQMDMKSPIYLPGVVENHYGPSRYLTFEGFSVDEQGKQHFLCATTAYRQTCLRVIEYLRRYGYNDYQIYLLLSCAPIQGHIASIVDVSSGLKQHGFHIVN